MGIINKDSNLYDKKGVLRVKAGHYPKGQQPLNGNMDVMQFGLSKHLRNVKKGIKN